MPKANRRNINLRLPSWEDFRAFDGAHCRNLYKSLPEDWRCPGCRRTRFEVLRWTRRFPKSPAPFNGWVGGYARHHDHSCDDIRYGRMPADGRAPRFPETIVCEQCNSADGAAKRKLGLPPLFSFAPSEIRLFVEATPHGFHTVDYEIARSIYHDTLISTAETPHFW